MLVVLDRDPRFTSRFWKSFQQTIGTKLSFNTTFHPHTDGQSERTIHALEEYSGFMSWISEVIRVTICH